MANEAELLTTSIHVAENPYKAPPTDVARARQAKPARSVRLSVMATLLLASLITGRLVTPADPASTFLVTIPIFGLSMAGYYFGLRQGTKPTGDE